MKMKYASIIGLALVVGLFSRGIAATEGLRVLILSGQNNHNWKETTPALRQILAGSGKFDVEATEHPEQCTAETFKKFDVVLSNWNTFGTSGVKDWPAATKRAYLDFVRSGKGSVVVHAGSSSFYDWPEYQQIAGASWKLGQTAHHAPHMCTVKPTAVEHPITRGMQPFTTTDELWLKPGMHPDAVVLATADGQPSALVTSFGKGRGFTLLLGHDARFMENPGFRNLLVRGTQWAATGTVTESDLSWKQSDKSLALLKGGAVVWQLNFADREGKPYFHPLRLPDGTETTALRPKDHPWHLGLWWSWKFINGVNYWESDPKTGKSEGTTEVTSKHVAANPDNSAKVEMELSYHLPQKAPVMTEKRVLVISAPDASGNYSIDWNSTFTAADKDVKLDRTPPSGHAGGVGWGGYAGLSVRFPAPAKGWTFTGSSGEKGAAALRGKPASWIDFSGPAGGVAIFDSPRNLRHPSPWYPNQELPYFSPAILFHEPYTLPAGKTLVLRYRVFVHGPGADLPGQWQKFAEAESK